MDETHSELEELLNTTRFSASDGYEGWLQERMDRLIEARTEPAPERVTGMRRLIFRSQPDLAPRRPLSAMSLAMLTLGVIAVTVFVIWPAMHYSTTPTPAASEPEMLAATATPIPLVLPTQEADMGLDVGELIVFPKAVNVVTDLAFSPDGRILAVATEGRTEFWNVEWRGQSGHPDFVTPGINHVVFRPDGLVVVAGESQIITIFDWDFTFRKEANGPRRIEPTILTASALAVNDLAISADGTRLIAAYTTSTVEVSGTTHNNMEDDSVVIWDMTQPLGGFHDSDTDFAVMRKGPVGDYEVGGSGYPVNAVVQRIAINSDGSAFATGTDHGTVRIYYSNGGSAVPFSTQENGITNLSFAVDSSILSVTGADGGLNMLTLVKGRNETLRGIGQIVIWGRPGDGNQFFEYSPDGTAAATVLEGNYLRVHFLKGDNSHYNGVQIKPGTSNRRVTAIAFSPNSNVLAIGTDDGSVWLWRWR